MISSQQVHRLGIFEFQPEQQSNDFDAVVAPVHIVSQENIFLGWRIAISLEDI